MAQVSCSDRLKAFQERRKAKLIPHKQFIFGHHPKYGLKKKETSFHEKFTHVRFDRKTLPKSGKSIVGNCFVEDKGSYHLIWDKETRALLGLNINKIEEYERKFNELRKRTSND